MIRQFAILLIGLLLSTGAVAASLKGMTRRLNSRLRIGAAV